MLEIHQVCQPSPRDRAIKTESIALRVQSLGLPDPAAVFSAFTHFSSFKLVGCLRIAATALLLCFHGVAFAQEDLSRLKISESSVIGNQIRLVVTDRGSDATSYLLESSRSLVGQWVPAPNQSFTKFGDVVTLSATRVGARNFYRVVGLVGTTTDPDGDGLTSTFETAGWRILSVGPLYTSDPTKSDTDSDGFSDGVEFSYGTNPRDPNSKPAQTTRPAIEFAAPLSSVTEGAVTHTIPLSFSAP